MIKRIVLATVCVLLATPSFAQSGGDIGKATLAACKWTPDDDTASALAKAYAGKSVAEIATDTCKAIGPRPSAAMPRYEVMKARAHPPVLNGVPLKGHFGPPYTDPRPLTH